MDAAEVKPSNVSVVVVSFNTCDKLRHCLSCIEPEHEVIVVDNGSADGSVEMVKTEFPRVRLIENSGNVGFGAANNQGMELARRELVLFLNSDAYAEPGAIERLSRAFEDPSVYGAGGKLLFPGGRLQDSVAGPLTLSAVFLEQTGLERFAGGRGYWQTRNLSAASPMVEVEQVMGACLMIRPVERFDERFFLYCEDTDLCARIKRHGKIVWVLNTVFTHDLGSSSVGALRWLSVARYNRGKELYFSIHRGVFAMAICWLFDRLGAFSRLLVYALSAVFTLGTKPQFRDKTKLWWKVLTVSPRGPDRPPHKAG